MKQRKRRKRLVHFKIQSALAFQAFFHWAVFLFAAFGLLLVWQIVTEDPYRPLDEHWQRFVVRYAPVIVVLIAMMPAVVYHSVKLSNRVLGPMVRLRNALQRLGRGEHVEPLRLRQRDYGQDFVEAFNNMLERVEWKDTPTRNALDARADSIDVAHVVSDRETEELETVGA